MQNIMLDLETMGTGKDAAIVAIGAIRMDLQKGKLGDTFYRVVNLKSAERAGGKIDADTVLWWLQQSSEAREALLGDNSVPIESALKDFSEWVRKFPLEGIWGNGSDFDNVIIEGVYLRLGRTPPWTYKQNRCYRTIRKIFPNIEKKETNVVATAHHALDDAIMQAVHLCDIYVEGGLINVENIQ